MKENMASGGWGLRPQTPLMEWGLGPRPQPPEAFF
jgi:hypothetical protein